jgi:hypothetical protein
LNLRPSEYVPFNNGRLTEGKYLLVKNVHRSGSKLQEGLKIESFTEPPKPRPKSS